jgi:hypothetical protein
VKAWASARVVLPLLALAAYTSLFYIYRLNVPYQDDINDILEFLLRYEAATGWQDQLAELYQPHNNHRTSFSRLVYLLSSGLAGGVNFTLIAALANLAWLSLAVVYASMLEGRGARTLAFAIAMLLLATPRAYVLMQWPMSGSFFFYVLFCAAASLTLLQRCTPFSVILAMLLAVIASFCGAAGILVWVSGGAYLCYLRWRYGSGSYGFALFWLLLAQGVISVVYEPMGAAETALPELWHWLGYFLVLVGSALAFGSVPVAISVGLLALLLLAVFMLRDWRSGYGPLHFMAIFLLAMAAAVVIGRADYTELKYALHPRYSVVSINILIVLLLLSLQYRRVAGLLMPAALAFCIACYVYYGPRYENFMNRRVATFNKGDYPMVFAPTAEMNAIVAEAEAQGLYLPPPRPQRSHAIFLKRKKPQSGKTEALPN